MISASTLLHIQSHRPFPLPKKSWKYYQEWNNTFFLHYKVPQEILWELLPEGLLLDTHQGQAWVSVVGFTVKNMRPKFLPPLPYLSDFHEINLRTYVIKDNIPGIYFISIEASKRLSVLMARELVGLKYKKAKIKRKPNRCILSKSEETNNLNIKYLPLQDIIEKTDIDKWLTERYCAYEPINKKMYRFTIHHKAWPLKKMKLRKLDVIYKNVGFEPENQQPDLVHFAREQKVLLWGRKRC